MFERWRERRAEVSELNLIPVMNLMVTLIPFLMLGAAFYHLGVIPMSLPTHEPGGTPENDVPVTLNLYVVPDRIVISANSEALAPEELQTLGLELHRTDGRFDLDALQAHLVGVKAKHPRSDTLVVLPDDTVRYQELVAILDVTRERPLAAESGNPPEREALFPVTVFSKRVPPEPDEPDGGVAEDDAGEGIE